MEEDATLTEEERSWILSGYVNRVIRSNVSTECCYWSQQFDLRLGRKFAASYIPGRYGDKTHLKKRIPDTSLPADSNLVGRFSSGNVSREAN